MSADHHFALRRDASSCRVLGRALIRKIRIAEFADRSSCKSRRRD